MPSAPPYPTSHLLIVHPVAPLPCPARWSSGPVPTAATAKGPHRQACPSIAVLLSLALRESVHRPSSVPQSLCSSFWACVGRQWLLLCQSAGGHRVGRAPLGSWPPAPLPGSRPALKSRPWKSPSFSTLVPTHNCQMQGEPSGGRPADAQQPCVGPSCQGENRIPEALREHTSPTAARAALTGVPGSGKCGVASVVGSSGFLGFFMGPCSEQSFFSLGGLRDLEPRCQRARWARPVPKNCVYVSLG